MKYLIIIAVFALHILFLICNSVNNTINSYFTFYMVKTDTGINRYLSAYNKGFSAINNKLPVKLYSRYTGSGMGYGFFAPNVLSSGAIAFEYKHKHITPIVNSYEGNVRFSSVVSRFISHMVQPPEMRDTASIDPDIKIGNKKVPFKKVYEIEDQYYEVVLKNIASKVYLDYGCNDTLKVRLYLYMYPSLKAYNKMPAQKDKDMYLCIKENNVFLK